MSMSLFSWGKWGGAQTSPGAEIHVTSGVLKLLSHYLCVCVFFKVFHFLCI